MPTRALKAFSMAHRRLAADEMAHFVSQCFCGATIICYPVLVIKKMCNFHALDEVNRLTNISLNTVCQLHREIFLNEIYNDP